MFGHGFPLSDRGYLLEVGPHVLPLCLLQFSSVYSGGGGVSLVYWRGGVTGVVEGVCSNSRSSRTKSNVLLSLCQKMYKSMSYYSISFS